MLQELRVENLLLIEQAELRLAPGLNVLTGETGAGKTVLAHALDLLLGGRPRGAIVRPGAAEAYVEGTFALPPSLQGERGELLAADAQEIVLARRVGADGRTRAYVGGRSATLHDLHRLGEQLLAFYGQHEHRKLTLAAAQLEILDRFCGPAQAGRLRACTAAYRERARVERELDELRELDAARERACDLLEHELAEIDAAAPREDELDELRATRDRLRALDALRAAAGHAAQALLPEDADAPGAAALLAGAARSLRDCAGLDPALDALAARCTGLQIEIDDLAHELHRHRDELDAEDGALESVEARLAALERLLRKHGPTLADVLRHAAAARSRHEELLGAAASLAVTTAAHTAAEATLAAAVKELHGARATAAPRLARAVRQQLAALAMPDARFEARLTVREPGPGGGDSVELLIAANPGVAPAPLREIASGGELSRIMLALTTVAEGRTGAKGDTERATLVFDEIDAGIGGHTARAVAERLRTLAATRQVLCITHLPQIASLADRHFAVVKDTAARPARTVVRTLAERDVVTELMRMLGASEDDAAARRHARELRKAA